MNHDEVLFLFQSYLAAELRAKYCGSIVASDRGREAAPPLNLIRHLQERARDSTFQFRLQRQGLAGASWLDAT